MDADEIMDAGAITDAGEITEAEIMEIGAGTTIEEEYNWTKDKEL